MSDRSVPDILDDWRHVEHERELAVTAEDRIRLDRQIAMLTVEYREAMDAEDGEAGLPAVPSPVALE